MRITNGRIGTPIVDTLGGGTNIGLFVDVLLACIIMSCSTERLLSSAVEHIPRGTPRHHLCNDSGYAVQSPTLPQAVNLYGCDYSSDIAAL